MSTESLIDAQSISDLDFTIKCNTRWVRWDNETVPCGNPAKYTALVFVHSEHDYVDKFLCKKCLVQLLTRTGTWCSECNVGEPIKDIRSL